MKKYIWGALIVGFVVFSLGPTFYELSRIGDVHPNRQFELVHNFPTDYNFYLSRIHEGLVGRFSVVEKYTSEPHQGSFIHEFYLLMGQVGRMVRVPLHRAGDIYHVARVVLAVVLLTLIAEFCRKSFDRSSPFDIRHSVFAFIFAVTASSWPKLVAVVNNGVVPATLENVASWRFGGYMAWWSLMDSLQRITFIPHILAGQALIVVLILLLTQYSVFQKSVNVLFIGVLAFVLGMIFPPGLLFVYTVMGIWVVLSGKRYKQWIVPYGVVIMMSVASLVYLGLMTGMYPWKRLVEVDIIRPLPFDYLEYFRAMGPILPLGVFGLIVALCTWDALMLPAVSWVLAWALLLGLFAFVPQQSPLRFSEMIPHVPLGVLTAYLFYIGEAWLVVHLGTSKKVFRLLFTIYYLLPVALIATGFFHMYSSYLWQRDFVDHKIRATLPLVPTGSYVMYPLKDFYNAMWYLFDTTKGEGVVMSETTAGNYIPAISGNTVFVGHDNTVNSEQKQKDAALFFSGKMSSLTAQEFLGAIGASYVFFGPQEREDGKVPDLRQMYPFLKEVYKNGYVTIFTTVE